MHDWHWIMHEEAKGASHERCMTWTYSAHGYGALDLGRSHRL